MHAPGEAPRLLESTGPLISSGFTLLPWEQASTVIEPDERVLLYTDGVTEAAGPEGQFGEDRLLSVLMQRADRGVDLLDAIMRDVRAFAEHRPARDDMTLVTLDRTTA